MHAMPCRHSVPPARHMPAVTVTVVLNADGDGDGDGGGGANYAH